MRAVFESRPGSGYDDDPTSRYPFPPQYYTKAREAVGEWVVYRKPRRGKGREGYIAAARVIRIEPNSAKPGHFHAIMADYLPFNAEVPLRRPDGTFYEGFLSKVEKPSLLGATMQGRAVRPLSEAEFGAIVRAGLAPALAPEAARRLDLEPGRVDDATRDLLRAPVAEQERRIVQVLQNRTLRDAAFRGSVLEAYDQTCAVTGLRIVNGGGRAEAEAAHIWPVAEGGPDVVPNGLALSATAHWLFDHHLIALTDELGLLVSHNRVPIELQALFERQRERIQLPRNRALWPHLDYVRRHREAFAG